MSADPVARDFEPGRDEPAVAKLWERSFGQARGGQTPDWLFRPGPGGAAPRSVVELDGRVVAHAGAASLRFRLAGEEVLGAYSVGAMTDPDRRGRGLFVRAARHLYARLEGEGFAFVAGFSNAKSHRLHTHALGRTALRPFPWCVRVLDAAAVGGALLGRRSHGADGTPWPEPREREDGRFRVAPVALDDARLDALWKRAEPSVRIGAVRDAAFARWRYATRPDAGYRAWLALREGEAEAWIVARPLSLRGLRALFVLDLVVAPEAEAAGRACLRALEDWAASAGSPILSALLPGGGTARAALRARRFRRVPEPLHPQVIRYSVLGLGGYRGCAKLADPAAWLLSWSDTDVV